MSCWVVPAVAAEYWGIPIAQVLERVRTGDIASKTEFGFMLVDVAPNSPQLKTGFRPPAARPSTYVSAPSDELSEAEARALAEAESSTPSTPSPVPRSASKAGSDETFDWRGARAAASRQRRAPRVAPLAA